MGLARQGDQIVDAMIALRDGGIPVCSEEEKLIAEAFRNALRRLGTAEDG